MISKGNVYLWIVWITFIALKLSVKLAIARQHRVLVDTDVDADDVFGLLYLLKINRSEIDLKAITINSNSWSNAGHAVNHIYDILFMMGRDDISVGVGGEGGISCSGTIFPNVGGYLPIIEQSMTTRGYCRYRQAIPVGHGGRLDIDTNYGLRKSFLPQGSRRYSPLHQPTTQEVMMDVISKGPTTIFLMGVHTNFALFLLRNPQLKKNVEHVYIMGGGDHGNLFTGYTSNPYAEYNMFGDPFAAYQVIHSGIPLTLVPLDATDTIPITKEFFEVFGQNQKTYEAQYCFNSLKMARDTWFDDQFFSNYYMWDSFMVGVAVSIMRNNLYNANGKNEFAEMKNMNITVHTSNKPFGISDGSNPFFYGRKVPRFKLMQGGVHSGHVQRSLRDPFCLVNNGKGKCKDGYTERVTGESGAQILVATRAKSNKNPNSPLDKEFFINFLEVLNHPYQSGRFNLTTQFPYYTEVFYKPNFGLQKLGNPVVLDIDMSIGDFLALFYLLKVPIEVLDLKAIFVTPTGWANAATIDVLYDLLHMMGRDDIQVGLGELLAINQSDCKYLKAIPHGSGGLLDSDTLYGLARDLPRSPRRFTTGYSVTSGAPRVTKSLKQRQPSAMEIWENLTKTIKKGRKITVLTNGPLTTLSKILSSDINARSKIQEIYVTGGHVNDDTSSEGNVFTVPSNKYAEFNMFLDPFSAKNVFKSRIPITLITLEAQKKVRQFSSILASLSRTKQTPEVTFTKRLISKLQSLHKERHQYYKHTDMFLGEVLGAVILVDGHSFLNATFKEKPIKVIATGMEHVDGQMVVDAKNHMLTKILENFDEAAYYDLVATRIGDENQSAMVGSFSEQIKSWSRLQED